ncbi:MAG: recombination protein RecR [Desulfobacteraceae bacterium 4572_19]|nr:MAG: recombination protein RecR [Desulfobacteraceae bacterium 4572_19]
MNSYPASITELINNFSKFPGIGKKTAERLVMHILKAPRKDAQALSNTIINMKDSVRLCSMCFTLSDTDKCVICNNPARNNQLICVVETPADMASLEKSGSFKGLYHILGGSLSPMDGIGPDEIRIRELVTRASKGNIKEIIIATGTGVEGESTASYIAQQLIKTSIIITRIASGVPMGGDLKYIDQVTLKRAMEARRECR